MKKWPLPAIGLLQAIGIVAYISLIGLFFWQAENWFGQDKEFFAPVLMLTLLSTSALICALITLAYPAVLALKKNQPVKALKIIGFTAAWLVLFVILIMVGVARG
jgi:hypothetical protein